MKDATKKLFANSTRGQLDIYALFDESSTITMLESDVADRIGLVGRKELFCYQWTN